ncbi:MAG TPA: MFS transporter [Gaiellaceae bacterium]|nr:MFS transporter [Gaiellaceae bacterium]
MLAAGTLSQASFSALAIGIPVLVPTLREEYDLSLAQIGVVLAAEWVGALATMLAWGIAADRFGERIVLGLGLGGCAAFLVGAAHAPDFESLVVLLALAGGAGASVNSASGRAVMHWFGAEERGLALGVRQTAVPLGGLVAALVVPQLGSSDDAARGFLFFAALCALGAVVGAAVIRSRDNEQHELESATLARTLRDGRLWRLALGSGIYVYAQIAIVGFGVVFLHDEHGLSVRDAALAIAAAQVLAVGIRIGAGRWSDVVGSRIGPLRQVGVVVAVSLVAVATLSGGPLWLLVPVLAVAGGLSMGWNALAFTAAAELAGSARSGAAIGFQQSVLSGIAIAAPIVFAATVSGTSWAVAFLVAALAPLAGRLALRPLRRLR